MEQPKLLIVDSMALLFRGFFATAAVGQFMQNSVGQYTNGLYQFTKYLLNTIETIKPTHVICAFDMGKETFRNELYPGYKANRGEPPTELIPQFDLLKELVAAFDIPVIGLEGFEADDVMGTLSKRAAKEGFHVYILTGDGDSLQLIEEQVHVMMMKKGFGNYEIITEHNLSEIKGISRPEQIIELKSLMGDASDNIPGCPGIGPKTAVKLLDEFGNLDNLFSNIDSLKGKMKEKLLENRELVYLSKDLATIRTDVPVECDLEAAILQFNRDKIHHHFDQLEFKRLHTLV